VLQQEPTVVLLGAQDVNIAIAQSAVTNLTTDLAAKADATAISNIDNTSDADKPVSTAQQTALNLKADLASPALTGTPTAPTAAQATNTTQIATTAFVQSNLTASLLRSALGIGEYVDDTAAGVGGLLSGDMYFNTTSNTYVLVA
jgi:hypothetical protein